MDKKQTDREPSGGAAERRSEPPWKEAIRPYQKSDMRRSSWQLINTLIPFAALWYLAYLCLDISYWAAFGVIVLDALLLVRVFIIAHDCGHGSFFHTTKANSFWGSITSILTFVPYYAWRHEHAIHHATSGDLDNRGVGDIMVLTVEEYRNSSRWEQFKYRLYRHPIVLFVLGPIWVFLLFYRFWPKDAGPRVRRSIIRNNLAILGMFVLAWFTIGIKAFALIHIPMVLMAGAAGIWMFFIHHQYEGVHWARHNAWTYYGQAIGASSYYHLPGIFKWLTGNIGFHHVHHLGSKIPNYYLEQCHNEVDFLRDVEPITFWQSLRFAKYRLWDEEREKLVTFAEVGA